MEVLFLFSGIAIGALVAWLWAADKFRKEHAESLGVLKNEVFAEKEKFLRADALFSAQKIHFDQLEKQFKETFHHLASQAVQENNKSFLNLAEKTLEKYTLRANSEMEMGSERIKNILKPLSSSLEKHEELIKQLENQNSQTFGSIKNHIDELIKKQNSLEKETGALVTALKQPKVRGKWGEIGLRRIVEYAGMTEFCHFDEQKSVQAADGVLRPDMIVYLPEKRKVVVDSKVPLLSYLNSLEVSDDREQELLLVAHAAALRKHVRDLSAKSYWAQFDDSVDFVVLYIEVESAFGTALKYDKDLINTAIKSKILFATPTTLIGLLQTISYAWRQHKATENAVEIWKQAKTVYERLAIFSDYLQKMGNSINSVVKSYNSAVGSWQQRVMPSVKKLSELGVSTEKDTHTSPETVDIIAKETFF